MAVPQFFVIIKGSKQGQFKGELNEAGHTAEIGGLRLSMENPPFLNPPFLSHRR